jgi:hypothetical protein
MKEVNIGGTKIMVMDMVEIGHYTDYDTGAAMYTVDANCVMSDGKIQTQYRGNKRNTIQYLKRNFQGVLVAFPVGRNNGKRR